MYPNNMGTGNYSAGSYMYNLVVWMGAEYDVRDFRDYWIRPHEEQNWMDKVWYDNPWFAANENVHSDNYNLTNGYISTGYQIKDWLKISLRTGLDVYGGREEWQNPISSNGGSSKSGYYALSRRGGLSSNTDFLILANKTWGDWSIDGFLGGTIYYWKNDFIKGETQNGISIPGFYSLQASVDPVKMSSRVTSKQTNSLYGKLSASWKNTVYIDVTGRNDWSSTLPEETRSYFYPSIASSLIISEMIPKQDWLSLWKIRGSWTVTKTDLEVYDTNNAYTINSNIWDGLNGATYPTSIRGGNVLPQASRSFEIGTAAHFLDNRLWTDITYYNKLSYDFARKAEISAVSGFNSTLINIDEELMRKGVEITIGAKPIVTNDFTWNLLANWSLDRCTYHKTDPVYSIQRDWVKEGERWDWIDVNDWERDPNGHIIHENGFPVLSQYKSKLGHANPNWIWGLTNTLKYKNFTLNVSIDGRVGGIAYARTNQSLWNAGSHIESDNQWRYDEVVNGKKNYIGEGVMVISGSVDYDSDGRIIRDDRIFAPNNKEVSYEGYINQYHRWNGEANTQNYFKQTFLKLRELSVTYDLPKQLCKKIKMENASVSFIGNNLFVWTKEFKYADPDKGSEQLASPSIRMLGFNLKVNF